MPRSRRCRAKDRRECPPEVGRVRQTQEFVRIEGDHVGSSVTQEFARGGGGLLRLAEGGVRRRAQRKRQSLVLQAREDFRGRVDRPVNDENQFVEDAGVVADERLDDVGLVADDPDTDDARRFGHAISRLGVP